MALYIKIRSLSFTLLDMGIIFRKMTLEEFAKEKDKMHVNMSEKYYNNLCKEGLNYSPFRKKKEKSILKIILKVMINQKQNVR